MPAASSESLDLASLQRAYQSRSRTPVAVLNAVLDRIEAYPDKAVWIHRLSRAQVMEQLQRAKDRLAAGEKQPLLGIPFAVKDNIDVANHPTTAACPAFAYVPATSATVVDKLMKLGAILIGKTNLDQFATGLVGTRSPYGIVQNPFDPKFIPGGSSQGSAVAVAAGLVSFALGTDTAGSGRVPAAFNNIVGLKPTRGRLSTAGLLPACRSLDCISVFALTCADAGTIASYLNGYDAADIYSRPEPPPAEATDPPAPFRFGVPSADRLRFFGNADAEARFHAAREQLIGLGGTPVTIDFGPFARCGSLLYDGPWLAERLWALRDLMANEPDALLPVTWSVIREARRFDAVATFDGMYELQDLRRQAAVEWKKMDVLLLPTTGTIYSIEEVQADPVRLNSNLGYYTNFTNLMDYCAVAVPAGFQSNGLPVGVSLMAPADQESRILALADAFHRDQHLTMGATGNPMPDAPRPAAAAAPTRSDAVLLAVVGAHLSGQPLNHQLTDRNARLMRTCRTSNCYRLFALPGTVPPKPGLIRGETAGDGQGVEVELWEMSAEAFGGFVAEIPPPLGVGTVLLEDGSSVKSFICESYAVAGAREITSFGGWRAFMRSL